VTGSQNVMTARGNKEMAMLQDVPIAQMSIRDVAQMCVDDTDGTNAAALEYGMQVMFRDTQLGRYGFLIQQSMRVALGDVIRRLSHGKRQQTWEAVKSIVGEDQPSRIPTDNLADLYLEAEHNMRDVLGMYKLRGGIKLGDASREQIHAEMLAWCDARYDAELRITFLSLLVGTLKPGQIAGEHLTNEQVIRLQRDAVARVHKGRE